jgi:type I restriction enzyme R subunit
MGFWNPARFGIGLGDSDKIWVEQQIAAAAEDGTLQAAAIVNDESNFGVVFDRRFEDIVISRRDDNGKLMQRYLDDKTLQTQLKQFTRRQAYQMIRRQKGIA